MILIWYIIDINRYNRLYIIYTYNITYVITLYIQNNISHVYIYIYSIYQYIVYISRSTHVMYLDPALWADFRRSGAGTFLVDIPGIPGPSFAREVST